MSQRQPKIKSEKKIEREKRHNLFVAKKAEMNNLLKEARNTYLDGLRQNKKKNISESKQINVDYKTSLSTIEDDYANKKISLDDKHRLISEAKQKRSESIEWQKSLIKNRKLAVISEYKRTLIKIQKTYMEDVIKHLFSYRLKRWIFGLNKEFSRVTWWSRKHVILDFVIIIIIVGILALIFMGIDMAYMKVK